MWRYAACWLRAGAHLAVPACCVRCLVLQTGSLQRLFRTDGSGVLDLTWYNDGNRIAAAAGNSVFVGDARA